jgi:hypothetical protein
MNLKYYLRMSWTCTSLNIKKLVGACGRRPLWSPCVKFRSQNWDPTSWKSRPKSFQVSVLETASVKIQAPKLRSQVLKTMSWKPYPKISHAPKSAGPVSRPPWVLPGPSHSHSPRPLSTKLLSGPKNVFGKDWDGKDCWKVRTERNCIID